MSILNQGRNEIRFNNSDGKCLLENWVEERQVEDYDTVQEEKAGLSSAQLFRDGHVGLLTTNLESKAEKDTTVRISYKPPMKSGVRLEVPQILSCDTSMDLSRRDESIDVSLDNISGNKTELMKQMFMEQAIQEVFKDDLNPPEPEPLDYKSVTAKDFNIDDFQHIPPKPTKNHNYRNEQPVTFWSEHKDKITGVSSVKTRDTPFRKNDAFSQPIDEYFDDTKPYDQENYPKM